MMGQEEEVGMKQDLETFHIDAPPEFAFDTATDPELTAGRFLETEVVNETPEGVGSEYRYSYRVLGMRLGDGTYTYSEYVPGRRFTMQFSPGRGAALTAGMVSSTWTFEPSGDGTDLTIRPQFKTRIPMLARLVRGIMMRSFRKTDLPRLKAEIERRARAAAKA